MRQNLLCRWAGLVLFCLAPIALAAAPPAKKTAPPPSINDDVPSRIKGGYSLGPILGYDPTFGFLFGGAVFRGEIEAPYSNASALIYGTSKGNLTFEVHDKMWSRERRIFNIDASFTNFFDPYYGDGDRTDPNQRRNIDNFSTTVVPSFGYRFDRQLTLTLLSTIKYRDERGVDGDPTRRIFGTQFRPDFGVTLIYDRRDNEVDTRQGGYAFIELDGGPAALSTQQGARDFLRVDTDFRAFVSPADWLVLAGQARAGTSAGDPGYLYRFTLGGSDNVRGYPVNRFRGDAYYLTQVEARFRILNWLALAAFGAAGDVADHHWSDFHGPRFGKGAGLRIGLPPNYVAKARLDFGFADDQSSIYLSFNEAF